LPEDEKKTEDTAAPQAAEPAAVEAKPAEAAQPEAVEAKPAEAAEPEAVEEKPAEAAEPEAVPEPKGTVSDPGVGKYFWGTGRRKSAVARVRIRPGHGVVIINKKPFDEYFPVGRRRDQVVGPLKVTNLTGQVDVWANVKGGGPTGQAGAVMMGLARAIVVADDAFEITLRDDGYLTRDPRMVERKKYGRHGARRGRQTSKR